MVKDLSDFKQIFTKLKSHAVSFTINTDGPEMLRTNLVSEYNLLLTNNILTKVDLAKASKEAREACFIKNGTV